MATDDLPDGLINAESRARQVLTRIAKAGLRVATAESCTGGLLASLLTDVEGVSSAFDRGFVTHIRLTQKPRCSMYRATLSRCMAL